MTAGRAEVRAFLDAHDTLTLACADAEGPWAADVYYARGGGVLYFFSSPESRHSRAFAADPRAAGTVHGKYEGWRDIRGVQLSGRVEPVASARETAAATAAYLARFPFARTFLAGARALAAGRFRLYRLTPDRVLFVDNADSFGTRTELEL